MPQPMSSLRGTWPNSLLLSYLVHPSTLLAVLRGRGAMVALRCCCRCAATAQCSFAAAIVLEFVVVLQADRDGIVGTFNARRACNDQGEQACVLTALHVIQGLLHSTDMDHCTMHGRTLLKTAAFPTYC
eukprot:GHRR01032165.1.p1 GENE.GHRR01032165.1~~GHRR01032165.1.p1  ORF type:complete len:129 (+),score=22.04 GHRR01032165.1:597-983(+)